MNDSVIWLSHPLSADTPAYGDGEGMSIETVAQISAGDGANTSRYTLPNHLGTHIDAPRHFFDSGKTLMDYPAGYWVFDAPVVVDVPGVDGHLIVPEDVEADITPQNDLLLLRTGFEAYRDSSRYWQHNPGLSTKLGFWLRENYPNIRAVGMDVISVTSRHHRAEGRLSHRALLDPDAPGNPILPIEDMALGHLNQPITRVIVAPLRVMNADGGPCTVLGY